MAFFVTWSPINFWKYVPNDVNIAQFSYRYLAQSMWIGSIIFAIAFLCLFQNKVTASYVVLGILVIGISSSSWFMTNENSTLTVKQAIANPDIGYGVSGYLVNPNKVKESYGYFQLNSYVMTDGWLISGKAQEFPTDMFKKGLNRKLILQGTVPNWAYHAPIKLFLYINQIKVVEYVLSPGDFSITVPLSKFIPLHTKQFSLMFKVDKPFVPAKILPNSLDNRSLSILVSKLSWQDNNDDVYMDVETTKQYCFWSKYKIDCHIPESAAKVFELPVLYYPHLLRIKLNGKDISYFPTQFDNLPLVGINTNLKTKQISIEFVGIRWANWVSAIAGLSCILLLCTSIFLEIRKKNRKSLNGDIV